MTTKHYLHFQKHTKEVCQRKNRCVGHVFVGPKLKNFRSLDLFIFGSRRLVRNSTGLHIDKSRFLHYSTTLDTSPARVESKISSDEFFWKTSCKASFDCKSAAEVLAERQRHWQFLYSHWMVLETKGLESVLKHVRTKLSSRVFA